MIIPVLHRILIKQDKLEETNKDYLRARAAGIVIPDHEDNKRAQAGVDTGTILAIGETAYRDFGTTPPIKVGDRIAYARFSGKFITDPEDNEEYVALNDEDIVCIFK
ncbi:MAG: co-chaperone GroES [Chitinophagaceae bacterium]|nr:co-chaperone GroES [Chitinophagaceae bacterium]